MKLITNKDIEKWESAILRSPVGVDEAINELFDQNRRTQQELRLYERELSLLTRRVNELKSLNSNFQLDCKSDAEESRK